MKLHKKRTEMIKQMTKLSLAVGLALLLGGCTVSNPVAPVQDQPVSQSASIGITPASQPDAATEMQMTTVFYQIVNIQKKIGSSGGTVLIPMWNDTSALVVPQNALSRKKTITIQAVCGYNAFGDRLTYYDFGPNGLTFSVPVELHHYTNTGDGVTSQLSWFNPGNSTWTDMASATINNGSVVYQLDHFSRYAVLERNATNYQEVDNRGGSNKTHKPKNNKQAK